MRLGLVFLIVSLWVSGRLKAADPPLRFVDLDGEGKLVYERDAKGNRIPDFSHAGYGGGGVPLPDAPVRVVVLPAAGDDGARIQAALDYVSHLPPDERGLRGAVLLGRGRFQVQDQLLIRASGVVLRGQGPDPEGTVVIATGNRRRTLIEVRGVNDRQLIGPVRRIVSDYVPVGARTLELDSTEGLKAGDAVLVRRPSPASWLQFLGMVPVPGRPAPTWMAEKMDILWERRIEGVEGRSILLDAPLTCALEGRFGGGSVVAYIWPGRLRQVGVENLRCDSEWDSRNPQDEEHAWMAIVMENVEDAWVRRVTAVHFVSSAVCLWETCRRVTVEDCESLAPVSEVGGYRRHSFYTAGQQTLFLRCRAEEGRHDFAVGWLAPGPNAFVHCEARKAYDFSGPIESWATGALYDNVVMDGGGLRFDNREIWDNGVGWAAANCVMWQCSAPVIIARNPPGAQNWIIGCWAQFVGDANWRSSNEFVEPESLYAAQLAERVGKAVASAALTPRPIPTKAGQALALEDVLAHFPSPWTRSSPPPLRRLSLSNGWLVVEGKLLIGKQYHPLFWRGHVQPHRAEEFGWHITRFVPGRRGPGFTDDLEALAEDLANQGYAGLRHHWGLWYDRRRDDHQMIRRMDADVWPPFYEQPWARSGLGRAWDGLSLYDLTKFNPWYFQRLQEFASHCARKGLVLINAMYFQHNLLEAGAHWADFPWRPANCLQATGFPEPPPYVNRKRIFMAEAFYDTTHPVRRGLHRAYIRHCLDSLAQEPNVLHVLAEEYSGPLSFVEFWLDVATEWRQETGKQGLLALSAPKDVQDAILEDPRRSQQVDVIDFKYWWRSGDRMFAPKGGQNLAPRQHEREAGVPRPQDHDLARMAAEYRKRYPEKAVICDFDTAGWAFVCAGGSLPNLPSTTAPRLLEAIPRMRPWEAATNQHQWALREPGRSYLLHSASGSEITLDLRETAGTFAAYWVDSKSGKLLPLGSRVVAGRGVVLPKPSEGCATLWLTRE